MIVKVMTTISSAPITITISLRSHLSRLRARSLPLEVSPFSLLKALLSGFPVLLVFLFSFMPTEVFYIIVIGEVVCKLILLGRQLYVFLS